MGGYFDIYKGLWIGITGPQSTSVPTATNHMVVNSDGSINVNSSGGSGGSGSATGTTTSVAAATTNTSILASNSSRVGATVYNDSGSANLFLNLSSSVASLAAFTVRLVPGSYYEVPFRYTGAVNGIWDAASGNARVTEFT